MAPPRVALVTGGTGGLGAACVRVLATRGWDVAIGFRSDQTGAEQLAAAVAEDGRRAVAVHCDVTDPADAAAAVDATVEHLGALTTLVHAAGPHIPQRHLSRVEPQLYAAHLMEEAGGFFNVVHPALGPLRVSHGSIVAITTAATQRFPVRDGLSSGTKGAIEQVVRALAVEEGRFGVRANSVGPGMLTDGMAARLISSGDLDESALKVTRSNIPLRRFGSADDIAEAVWFLASDAAGFISGQHLCVDGGYSA